MPQQCNYIEDSGEQCLATTQAQYVEPGWMCHEHREKQSAEHKLMERREREQLQCYRCGVGIPPEAEGWGWNLSKTKAFCLVCYNKDPGRGTWKETDNPFIEPVQCDDIGCHAEMGANNSVGWKQINTKWYCPDHAPTYVQFLKPDPVNHPAHYTHGNIETIEVIEDTVQDPPSYYQGCIIKYVSRALHKGDTKTNLEKARWYLNRWINALESGE